MMTVTRPLACARVISKLPARTRGAVRSPKERRTGWSAADVRSDDDVERAVAAAGETFGGELDILIHSVAFAAAEDLEGRFTDTPRDRFWMALDVSAYSLIAVARAAEPLLEAAGGGLIVTLTYLRGVRAVPHHNVRGVPKAALDSSVQSLGCDR